MGRYSSYSKLGYIKNIGVKALKISNTSMFIHKYFELTIIFLNGLRYQNQP